MKKKINEDSLSARKNLFMKGPGNKASMADILGTGNQKDKLNDTSAQFYRRKQEEYPNHYSKTTDDQARQMSQTQTNISRVISIFPQLKL
jgi:ectoine hydroxylase-related dioxygenase (phytanoyl-CoA dioxygenase family)